MAITRRCLPLIIAGLLVGSCGSPPPGPTQPPARSAEVPTPTLATPTATIATTPPPTPDAAAGSPRIIIRSATPSGAAAWSVTEPGQPQRRWPLEAPFTDLELGPASEDGLILASTTDAGLIVSVGGASLTMTASVPVPPGRRLVPGCFAGDGRSVYADGETLTLVLLTAAGIRPFSDVPFTLGECAPMADGRTLVAIDGGGLVAVDESGTSTAIVGALGRHLSGGNGLIAMKDPSHDSGDAVVRRGTVSADGRLGAAIGRIAGQRAERVVNAQLSPDGGWLVVLVERETEAQPEGRLRLYRVAADGLELVSDSPIEVGTRVTVLPGS
jgi:hypothetical protein